MEWVERLNQSMKYIEEHLTEQIDYEQLGQIACCSTQRMFTYMAGISLAEYIRRRKMSLAAVDLQDFSVFPWGYPFSGKGRECNRNELSN